MRDILINFPELDLPSTMIKTKEPTFILWYGKSRGSDAYSSDDKHAAVRNCKPYIGVANIKADKFSFNENNTRPPISVIWSDEAESRVVLSGKGNLVMGASDLNYKDFFKLYNELCKTLYCADYDDYLNLFLSLLDDIRKVSSWTLWSDHPDWDGGDWTFICKNLNIRDSLIRYLSEETSGVKKNIPLKQEIKLISLYDEIKKMNYLS